MCLRNPGGGSKAPPPPVAVPPPVAFPPEVSTPPVHIGHPGPPQIYIGMPMHNVLGTDMGVWTTGLFGCFDDLSNCLTAFFCPCVTFGQNVEIIDRGSTSCAGAGILCFLIFNFFICLFCYTCTYRTKLRASTRSPATSAEIVACTFGASRVLFAKSIGSSRTTDSIPLSDGLLTRNKGLGKLESWSLCQFPEA